MRWILNPVHTDFLPLSLALQQLFWFQSQKSDSCPFRWIRNCLSKVNYTSRDWPLTIRWYSCIWESKILFSKLPFMAEKIQDQKWYFLQTYKHFPQLNVIAFNYHTFRFMKLAKIQVSFEVIIVLYVFISLASKCFLFKLWLSTLQHLKYYLSPLPLQSCPSSLCLALCVYP